MKKKERNLLYPLPIAEIDEQWMKKRIESVIDRPVEKINREVAACYKGIIESALELSDVFEHTINGKLVAYHTQIPEVLSFALKHAHGVQHLTITEKQKKGKPNITYDFGVTDVEFHEEYLILFGIAKNLDTKNKKEYLLYFFPDVCSFYKSDILIRKMRGEVFWEYNEKEEKRLSMLIRFAYKYLKKAHEVKLCKNTAELTGCIVSKPGKQMFLALSKQIKIEDETSESYKCLKTTLDEAFHRLVQTSLGNANVSTYVCDENDAFSMCMEKMTPCCDKKGFRFEGLRFIEETPWKSFWMNLEYDYKKNIFIIYNKDWTEPIGQLKNFENEEGKKALRVIRRCVNSYYKATK